MKNILITGLLMATSTVLIFGVPAIFDTTKNRTVAFEYSEVPMEIEADRPPVARKGGQPAPRPGARATPPAAGGEGQTVGADEAGQAAAPPTWWAKLLEKGLDNLQATLWVVVQAWLVARFVKRRGA